MRILIIGAGNTGKRLAEKLCALNHDIVVIDEQREPLEELEAQLDVLTIQGNGASPHVLEQAEIDKTDLVIGVTDRDEVNILACSYARACGVSYKVARVSNADYGGLRSRLDIRSLGADLVVCHKEESAKEIFNTLRTPGALEVVDLLGGRLLSVGVKTAEGSPLIGARLKDLSNTDLLKSMRFIGSVRGENILIPHGDTQFQPGDEVYFVIRPADLREFLDWSCPRRTQFEKVVISGGGEIGLRLAELMEDLPVEVVLIELDAERADYCSGVLNKTLVIGGNSLDRETLEEVGIVEDTAFVAVMGDDENNIIGCLLAKKLGVSFTLAQVNKAEYLPIINSLDLLDRTVSPHQPMINAILHFARGGNVKASRMLHNLPIELSEIDVPAGKKWVGRKIEDIRLLQNVIVVAVLRDDKLDIPTGGFKLEAGDQLVISSLPEAADRLQSIFSE